MRTTTYRGNPLGQCSDAELREAALLLMEPADPTTLGGWAITKLAMQTLPEIQCVMISRRDRGGVGG